MYSKVKIGIYIYNRLTLYLCHIQLNKGINKNKTDFILCIFSKIFLGQIKNSIDNIKVCLLSFLGLSFNYTLFPN